ncbi:MULTISPECIES: DUF4238 domain-containing protein [Pseudomonas syringae group]|uniref:DUF4238 domain-containing protein n=2 Tax=Pseudomonas amygdali TaxID=47877 RepID=A0A3M6H466_PSEAJ|nr:DUF4238 domain-containing protein [Pseudomonas amygdali]MEE4085961.1 DUF4238 domain-containing protein [Pseudomonas viridiflava]MEE4665886.1 DUF4238 domain-containing protein [Pseudomonas alliivorans]MEE4944089.1 DUF4238 domain-containing protein [Pseudomonas alliivorans]RMV99664.1 hypothetical protein ALP03_200280 [Pseudomonas amygdali pv. tabaci]
MSGVRQHFIPRFLQKGFRTPSNGKIVRCWVYEQNKPPRSANIQDVGLERYFYAINGEPDLDDKITDAERDVYAPLVGHLRAGNLNAAVIESIPGLLAHLEIRSRHVRQNMQSMVDECASGILDHLSDPLNLGALSREHFRPGSTIFDKALAEQGISQQQIQALLAIDESALEQIFEPLVDIFASLIPAHLSRIKSSIPDMIKDSHVRMLNESVSPAVRAHRFSALHYSVHKFEPGDLPLGDSVVLFHVRGERSFKPFMDKDDELVHVVLPLASDRYLLGASDASLSSPPQNLPLEIARCSMGYFICANQSDRAADLQAHIGSNAGWLSAREMNTLLGEVLSGLAAPQRAPSS